MKIKIFYQEIESCCDCPLLSYDREKDRWWCGARGFWIAEGHRVDCEEIHSDCPLPDKIYYSYDFKGDKPNKTPVRGRKDAKASKE